MTMRAELRSYRKYFIGHAIMTAEQTGNCSSKKHKMYLVSDTIV